jgi:hypothetical protein
MWLLWIFIVLRALSLSLVLWRSSFKVRVHICLHSVVPLSLMMPIDTRYLQNALTLSNRNSWVHSYYEKCSHNSANRSILWRELFALLCSFQHFKFIAYADENFLYVQRGTNEWVSAFSAECFAWNLMVNELAIFIAMHICVTEALQYDSDSYHEILSLLHFEIDASGSLWGVWARKLWKIWVFN